MAIGVRRYEGNGRGGGEGKGSRLYLRHRSATASCPCELLLMGAPGDYQPVAAVDECTLQIKGVECSSTGVVPTLTLRVPLA